jgi:hypothetical protein
MDDYSDESQKKPLIFPGGNDLIFPVVYQMPKSSKEPKQGVLQRLGKHRPSELTGPSDLTAG